MIRAIKNNRLAHSLLAAAIAHLSPGVAMAHEPSEIVRQRMLEEGLVDVTWLWADHMLTDYDHILILLGGLFFLTRWSQIVAFITVLRLAIPSSCWSPRHRASTSGLSSPTRLQRIR